MKDHPVAFQSSCCIDPRQQGRNTDVALRVRGGAWRQEEEWHPIIGMELLLGNSYVCLLMPYCLTGAGNLPKLRGMANGDLDPGRERRGNPREGGVGGQE